MSFMLSSVYDSIDYNPCVEGYSNGYNSEVNQEVGYKWYQSHPSSDMDVMDASPCSCGCPTPSLQTPVSNPTIYYPVEYKPPEPPPLSPHSNSSFISVDTPPIYMYYSPYQQPTPPNTPQIITSVMLRSPSTGLSPFSPDVAQIVVESKLFDGSPEREFVSNDAILNPTPMPVNYISQFTLTYNTTLSTGQFYYGIQDVIEDVYANTNGEVNTTEVIVTYSEAAVVIGDGSNLVEKAVEVQKELIGDEVEVATQLFDKSPVRNSDFVVETVSKDDLSNASNVNHNASSAAVIGSESSCNILANNFYDSFVMDNLLIHQNSSSVTEYVEDFMHIKSRAEFIFQCSFDDGLLVYCFIDGLKAEIREALELSAPRTLEMAIDLAKFQESVLEGMFLLEPVNGKSDTGLNELELQVHTINGVNELSRGIHRDKDVDTLSSLTVMQLITQPGAATILNDLAKRYINACQNYTHNFDPGGGTIDASVFTIAEGIFELLFKAYNSHENAFCCYKEVWDEDIQTSGGRTVNESVACLERNELFLVFTHTSAGHTIVAAYAVAIFFLAKRKVISSSLLTAWSSQKSSELSQEFVEVEMIEHNDGITILATIKLFPEITSHVTDIHQQAYECIKTLFLTRINTGNTELSPTVLGHLHL